MLNQTLSKHEDDFKSSAIRQFLQTRESWNTEGKNFSEISGKLPLQSVTAIFIEDQNEPDEKAIKSLKDIVGEEIDEMFNIGRVRPGFLGVIFQLLSVAF